MVDPGLQFRAEDRQSEASKRSLGASSLRLIGPFIRKHEGLDTQEAQSEQLADGRLMPCSAMVAGGKDGRQRGCWPQDCAKALLGGAGLEEGKGLWRVHSSGEGGICPIQVTPSVRGKAPVS